MPAPAVIHAKGSSTSRLEGSKAKPATEDEGDMDLAAQGPVRPRELEEAGGKSNQLGLRCQSGYCPPPPLRWFGGPVQLAPEVHLIFWGSNWNSEPGAATRTTVTKMFEGLRNSEYQEILNQYFNVTGHILDWAVEVNSYTDTSVAAPSNVNDASIEAEVAAAIASHSPNWGWSDNEQFMVLPAPGTSYASEFDSGFCAYHDYFGKTNYVYSIIPYAGDDPFSSEGNCDGYYGKGDAAKATSVMASHEYAESATDPIWYDQPAWMDLEGYEISDLCSTPYDELPNGTFVQGQYDNHQNKCSLGDYNPPSVMALTDTASNVGEHSATINATIYPEQSATTYKFEWGTTTSYGSTVPLSGETSAGSSLGGVGVSAELTGLTREQVYHYRVRAKNAWGTTYGEDRTFVPSVWAIHPQSQPERTDDAFLNDIDCVNSGQCVTVGYYYNVNLWPGAETNQPLTYSGSGSEWKFNSVPLESEDSFPRLDGVSCSSASACTAVGKVQRPGGVVIPLIARWNGSSWSRQPISAPAGSGYSELEDISCPSSSECIAVGYSKNSEGKFLDYSARWNGSSWSNLTTPSPEGVKDTSTLEDVSCPSAGHCEAVGWYNPLVGGAQKVVMVWNGSSWTMQSAAVSSGWLGGVDCLAANSCVAVGGWGTAVERWDGSKWSTQETPKLAKDGYLEGISCASTAYCVATGGAFSELNGAAYTLAEVFSEGKWQVRPTSRESEYAYNELWSVACTEAQSCTAVGGTKASGPWNPLIETKADLRPTIKAETSASYPGPGKATLKGELNPHGFASHYHLEWGTEAEFKKGEYNHRAPLSVDASSGSAETNTAVEQTIEGLKGKTLYHYRFVAESSEGKSIGSDHSLTTPEWPPVLSAVEVTEVGIAGVHLGGTVDPKGFETKYRFEYVNAVQYGLYGFGAAKKAPVPDGTIAAGGSAVPVSTTLKELEPHTTYHVRLEASSDGGTATGEDKTFTTPPTYTTPTSFFTFGTSGTGNGQLSSPESIAFDSSGNFWVVDSWHNRVQKFNTKGEYLAKFGSSGPGDGQFSYPRSIAIDPEGDIWVTDFEHSRLEQFNANGEYMSKISSPNGAYGLAIDSKGNLWDNVWYGVIEFNQKGEQLLQFGKEGTGNGQFSEPMGIAIGPDGNIWVLDTWNNRVQEFSPQGEFMAKFGTSGSGDGKFNGPQGIAIDPEGNIWIADTEHHRIQEMRPEGEFMVKLGTGTAGSGEGQFKTPYGIALDATGNIWIADSGNNRIQEWKQGAPYPVLTGATTSQKRTEATLNATVNPQGVATSYQFAYGTTASLGKVVPASPKSVGSGSTPVKVAETLKGLKYGTTYYYRVIATTEKGTTYGETRHFSTLAGPGAEAKWMIGGKTLAELGIKEQSFILAGTLLIEMPSFNFTFKCKESGSGKVSSTNVLEETLTLTCAIIGEEARCSYKPVTIGFSGTATQIKPNSSTFTLNEVGETCAWFNGQSYVLPTTFAVEVGSEAVSLPVLYSGSGKFGENPMIYSGLSTWELIGANNGGKALGFR